MKDVLKQMLKIAPKKLIAGIMTLAIVAGISAPVLANFGPDRPTKAWSPSVSGFDHVTFNSFTGVGNGVGDERDFLRGVQVGRDSVWADPVNGVTQDAEVEAKIYIHNNADASLNDQPGNPGVAKNVNVRVALPTGAAQTHNTSAYISADNAQPGTIFDTLTMTGANNGFFNLEYKAGSAVLHNQDGSTSAVSDNLVTTGANIGDQKGCFQYVRELTFRMKVKMPEYNLQKSVRLEGQTSKDWVKSLSTKPGQTVEWKLEFDNIGRTVLNHVVILDQLPSNVTVVPGSVKLVDGNFPNGVALGNDTVQSNGTQINVDIGSVNPGINSIIAFKTKINDVKDLQCGTHELVNTGYATPQYLSSIKNDAKVIVTGNANCQPPQTPKELVKAGPGDVIGIFAGVTIGGALWHKLYWARRQTR